MSIAGSDSARLQRLQRIAVLAPTFYAALQRSNANHSFAEQKQRRPGAGGFVWSRTVEDHVLIARNFFLAPVEGVQVDQNRAGKLGVIRIPFERPPEIDHRQIFAGLDHAHELLGCYSIDAELANESPALIIFPAKIDRQQTDEDEK